MKKIVSGAAGLLALFCCVSAVQGWGQASPLTATPATASAPEPVAQRSKQLSRLFAAIWEDRLTHSPEFASSLGDRRYNDQLTDYSAKAVNDELERGREYIQQLSAIDTAGLPDQEQLSAELMLRSLIDQQEGAKFKTWEMPVNQFSGFHTELPRMVSNFPFETIKDYDDYIARLQKVPNAFSQIMTNMELGVDEGRVPPQY